MTDRTTAGVDEAPFHGTGPVFDRSDADLSFLKKSIPSPPDRTRAPCPFLFDLSRYFVDVSHVAPCLFTRNPQSAVSFPQELISNNYIELQNHIQVLPTLVDLQLNGLQRSVGSVGTRERTSRLQHASRRPFSVSPCVNSRLLGGRSVSHARFPACRARSRTSGGCRR